MTITTCNILQITDGTTIVDFMNPATGVHLDNWDPQIQQPKGGGVFQDSPLAPGRRRIYSQLANARENFSFKVNDLSRNNLINRLSTMIDLLEKAAQYDETDFQNTPVYLVVQSESGNVQYALVKSYTFLEIDNPYAQPFFTRMANPAFDNLNLEVERGPWLSNIPGQSEATSILVQGSEYSEEGISFLLGAFSPGAITHIYVDDGGAFGSNQVASTSFSLLPAAPVVDDAVYFGNTDGYGIYCIAFDLATAFEGTSVEGVWEIWEGASWGAILSTLYSDGTNEFTSSGVVAFYQLTASSSGVTTVNGVEAYWLRFRVTTATGVTSVPSQQNRIVYAVTDTYMQIASGTVLGNLPALAKITLDNIGNNSTSYYKYILALRSQSRGTNFEPFINLYDQDQPNANISVSVNSGVGTAFGDSANIGFREIYYDATSDPEETGSLIRRWTVTLGAEISNNYSPGRYFVYVLIAEGTDDNSDTMTAQLRLENSDRSTKYWQSDTISVVYNGSATSNRPNFFGTMIIPRIRSDTELNLDFYLNIASSKTTDLRFHAIVLAPIDEWAIITDLGDTGSGTGTAPGETLGNRYFVVDSTNPKDPIDVTIFNDSDDSTYAPLRWTTNGQAIIRDNSKIWMFVADSTVPEPTQPHQVTAFSRNDRYLSLRGSN